MSKIRVLILEDDYDIIDLIQSLLGREYECIEAHNGLEGLQQAQKGEPDLVIADIMMPVMDGLEFVRRLRRMPGLEGVPVIFLSALSSREQIRQGYELGAALYLTKPIDPGRLKRNLQMFIQEHRLLPKLKRHDVASLSRSHLTVDEDTPPPMPPPKPVAQAGRGSAPQPPPPKSAGSGKGGGDSKTAEASEETTQSRTMGQILRLIRDQTSDEGKMRVLVVEDDADTTQFIRSAIEQEFEVLETDNGISAIEYAARYKPDLFIIDGMLPRMTGYQLSVMLKKNRQFYRTPIIFISGRATQRDIQYVKRLGITQFLAKPFSADQLRSTLQEVVSQPGFSINKQRPSIGQIYLEQFQQRETHRKSPRKAAPTYDQLERDHLEKTIKKQTK